jgi:RNA polymerase sigma-70 factor, ECF subfamily
MLDFTVQPAFEQDPGRGQGSCGNWPVPGPRLSLRSNPAPRRLRVVSAATNRICGELYARHSRRIFGLCLLLVRDREQAQDLCHEAFLSAIRNWEGFEHRSQDLTWLVAIAKNTCYTYLRRRKHRASRLKVLEQEESVAGNPDEEDQEEKFLAGILFEQTLEKVRPNTRRILIRYYRECFRHGEIASELGQSRAAVSKTLSKVRAGWKADKFARRRPDARKVVQSRAPI